MSHVLARPSPQPRSLQAGGADSKPRSRTAHAARLLVSAPRALVARFTAALYLIVPDISHYQARLSLAYPRDFVIFKVTQAINYVDDAFRTNAAVAAALYARGNLAGAICYHVFSKDTPAAQFAKIKAQFGDTPPPWLAGIMIDLESWAGTSYALRGDHSASVNELGRLLADWLGGNWRRVWLYGNRFDLADLAPHRDPRMPVIVAAYTSDLVYETIAGAIGQQYSDGETKYGVPIIGGQALPRSTSGLGNCDHNVFPGFVSGAALRQWIDAGGTDNNDPMEVISNMDGAPKTYAQFRADVRADVAASSGPSHWTYADVQAYFAQWVKRLNARSWLWHAFHDATVGKLFTDDDGTQLRALTIARKARDELAAAARKVR